PRTAHCGRGVRPWRLISDTASCSLLHLHPELFFFFFKQKTAYEIQHQPQQVRRADRQPAQRQDKRQRPGRVPHQDAFIVAPCFALQFADAFEIVGILSQSEEPASRVVFDEVVQRQGGDTLLTPKLGDEQPDGRDEGGGQHEQTPVPGGNRHQRPSTRETANRYSTSRAKGAHRKRKPCAAATTWTRAATLMSA